MRAGALKADVCAFFGEGIDQHPIWFDMRIPATGKIPTQGVIPIIRRERFALYQPLKQGLSFALSLPRF